MVQNDIEKAINRLSSGERVERNVWHYLLTSLTVAQKEFLRNEAACMAKKHFGNGIYIRGLIEISSYCKNNCLYCGLRCGNGNAKRYRLSHDDILRCCRNGAEKGFNTFVLQGGEDPMQNDEWIADVVKKIKKEFPDKALTLSVGERSDDAYAAFRKAGADRYLLRHETRNDSHYKTLHPHSMSPQNRRRCLEKLKELGYQTGSGMMIGTPGQTTDHIIDDLQYLEELQPEMIGIGPFIPATGTPFANHMAGSIETTVLLLSLLRLRFPKALIPATTALATLCEQGSERAILAGANVIMPNLSPTETREKYSIYNNKKINGSESAEQIQILEKKLSAIGYCINYERGDY